MITILALGEAAPSVAETASGDASVEVLVSRDVEDALEKLARNRRIDAILITDSDRAAEFADAIRDEDPASPPLYAPASAAATAGVSPLTGATAEELLDGLIAALGS
jgi:hypothetical protein